MEINDIISRIQSTRATISQIKEKYDVELNPLFDKIAEIKKELELILEPLVIQDSELLLDAKKYFMQHDEKVKGVSVVRKVEVKSINKELLDKSFLEEIPHMKLIKETVKQGFPIEGVETENVVELRISK